MEHKGQTKRTEQIGHTFKVIDNGSLPNACNAFHFPSLFEKRENFADQLNEVTWLSSHGTPWSQVFHSGPCHISEWYQNFDWSTYDHQDKIQDPLPTLLFLRLPLCCFCDPLCCFCGPLCWNVFPFCWFGDPFCCFLSAKWECVFPKCHPPSRMLILYLSRINNCGPSKAKNQQFLSNKTESTNCIDQSLVGSFQDLQMIALWKLSLRRRQSSISHSILLSFLSLL